MTETFRALDDHLSSLLGAQIGRVRPGEIRVAITRDPEPVSDWGGEPVVAPIRLLVCGGRGVILTTRFLAKIAEAWAGDFAAPDYLLRHEFLDELRASVATALEAEVTVASFRILAGSSKGRPIPDLKGGHALSLEAGSGGLSAIVVRDSEREAARSLLAAGWREYGRWVQFEARR